MAPNLSERFVAGLLIVYLLAMGLTASANLVVSFDLAAVQASSPAGSAVVALGGAAASSSSESTCSPWLVVCHLHGRDSTLLAQAALAASSAVFFMPLNR